MSLLKARFKTPTFSEAQCSLGLFCAQQKTLKTQEGAMRP